VAEGLLVEHRELGLAVLFVAGVLAGGINSFAGGGSFLTLPLLAALGLPPSVANGTIRVGILPQNAVILATFWRQGVRPGKVALALAIPVVAGAGAGAWAATRVPDEALGSVFGAVFLAWALVLLVRPGRFLSSPDEPEPLGPLGVFFAVLIGGYGGFMQAGVGFPLLALLVMFLGYPPLRANAIKAALVAMYTVIALAVFATAGKIAWTEAIILAFGTGTGGWIGTRLQLKLGPGAVRWAVLIMVSIAGAFMLAKSLA
jgi:uncharacterized membrane protein YfcA